MVKLLQNRLPKQMTRRQARKKYVVSPSARQRNLRVSALLRRRRGITVLDELDDSTALVVMSDRALDQLSQEHPELVIEPDLIYTLQG
jgi:Ethanolamine utilization protein EutJ (predicted chaperonin)